MKHITRIGLTRFSLSLFTAGVVTLMSASSVSADVTSYSTDFDSMTTGSIFGQEGWAALSPNAASYVQGVTTAAAHSGSQSWLLSSSYNDGSICTMEAPEFAPVGETHTIYGGTPAYDKFNENFWFRSVATSADAGLHITNSLGTAASVRNTWIGIDGSGGNLTVSAFATDASGNFTINPSTAALTWGAWYQVKETATFVDGANNDLVHYQILDANGNVLLDSTIGSWESYYANDPTAEQAPGPVASDRVSFGLGGSGTDQGIYIDDWSESVSSTIVPVPEPSQWAPLIVAGVVGILLLRRRSQA